jgi:hypothetical protein
MDMTLAPGIAKAREGLDMGDDAGPRQIVLRLEELGGVGAVMVELRGEIVRLGGVAPANGADLGGVPVGGFHRPHPMSAATSKRVVQAAGAAPIAMTKATAPSILPIDRFFESFLFPASPRSITEFAIHMVKTG